MINWATIERAIVSLAISTTGLNPSRIIQARQKAPRGQGPWLDFRIGTVISVGRDWSIEEDNPESTGNDGQEILTISRGARMAHFVFRCFGDPNNILPEAILHDLVSKSRMQERLNSLNAAGIGLASWDPILPIDGVIQSTMFEPRATVTMRAHLASEVEDFSTYIESVELENQIDGTTRIVTEGDYDGE